MATATIATRGALGAGGHAAYRRCGASENKMRRAFRAHVRAGAGLRTGQPCHPAAAACRGFPAFLPAQSEAVPAHRRFGGRAIGAYPRLAADLDIRTDLPRYRVWRDGAIVDEPADLMRWWRDDLVTFAIGCSFSFEQALIEDGIELRHFTCNCTVPMYRTSIETVPAGPFHGPLVVSMRPMKPADAIRAVQITTRFPSVHGAPVHLAKPEANRHQGYRQAGLGRPGADR